MNILFVCSANQIRSRMAEAIWSHLYPDQHYRSRGCGPAIGIDCAFGIGIDERVRRALRTIDIPCPEVFSTELRAEDLSWADLIFAMDTPHYRYLNACAPTEKVVCLQVADPANTGLYEDYFACAENLLIMAKSFQ